VSDNAAALLAEARSLLVRPSRELGGAGPRAVALLTRQALEIALDDFWRWKAPGAQTASRAAQLLCLSTFLKDDALAAEVRFSWFRLSKSCHHHVYELAPTSDELNPDLESVARFLKALATLTP
jgi:hypothetical protein